MTLNQGKVSGTAAVIRKKPEPASTPQKQENSNGSNTLKRSA